MTDRSRLRTDKVPRHFAKRTGGALGRAGLAALLTAYTGPGLNFCGLAGEPVCAGAAQAAALSWVEQARLGPGGRVKAISRPEPIAPPSRVAAEAPAPETEAPASASETEAVSPAAASEIESEALAAASETESVSPAAASETESVSPAPASEIETEAEAPMEAAAPRARAAVAAGLSWVETARVGFGALAAKALSGLEPATRPSTVALETPLPEDADEVAPSEGAASSPGVAELPPSEAQADERPPLEAAGAAPEEVEEPFVPETVEVAGLAPDEVDDTELAELRGGFVTVGGLMLDIGLQIHTIVDGVPKVDLVFDIDAGITSSDPAIDTISTTDFKNIIQVGPGNVVNLGNSFQNFEGVLTVIQNSLPETVIQHITAIEIDVLNSTSFFEGAALTRSLDPAIINSLP